MLCFGYFDPLQILVQVQLWIGLILVEPLLVTHIQLSGSSLVQFCKPKKFGWFQI